jgi:HAD superfamily hydrolase (TIGR01509 family)
MRTLLIDVGGTLWPNTWTPEQGDDEERVDRLRTAVPALNDAEAAKLVGILSAADHPAGDRQQGDALIAEAIGIVRPGAAVAAQAVRTAMCLPAPGRVEPFPGARELLAGLATRGIRVVVVTNVLWRDGDAQRRDFDDLGLSEYVHAYVSSADVGWRKPHPAFFQVALTAAGCSAGQCVMVGDSEPNDIEPAHALGMLTIRVAIEESLPSASVADYVCGSLSEVARVLFERVDRERSTR